MLIGIVGVVVNVIANLLLIGPLKHGGLALGTSLAAWYLRQQYWSHSLLAHGIQGVFGQGAVYDLVGLVALALVGIVVYVGCAWAVRTEPAFDLWKSVRTRKAG